MPLFLRLSTLVTSQQILPSTTKLTREVLYDIAAGLTEGETLFPVNPYEHAVTSLAALDTTHQYHVKFYDLNLHSIGASSAMLLNFKGQNINYCEYPSDEEYRRNCFDFVRVTDGDCDTFLRFPDRAVMKTNSDQVLAEMIDKEVSYTESGARTSEETGRLLRDLYQ